MAVKDVTNDNAGWQTVVEPFADTFKFENPGDNLIGIYEGFRVVPQDDLNIPGEKRDAMAYTIVEAATGDKFTVWGSYNVDLAFKEISPGNQVRITFEGKANLEGGRSVNKFRVEKKGS